MNPPEIGPLGPRTKRIPIGYRMQPGADGTVAVLLDAIAAPPGSTLGPSHRQILQDYRDARRSVRNQNRQIRAGSADASPPANAAS